MKIRIFVVDDNIVARSMMVHLLSTEDDIEVVGEAGTGQGGIIMLSELQPDIILLEAAVMGGMKLNDVIGEIKKISPETRIMLCTDPSTQNIVISTSELGVMDFVHKPYRKITVLRTIREVMSR